MRGEAKWTSVPIEEAVVLDSQRQADPSCLQCQDAPAIRMVCRSLLFSSGDFRCRFPLYTNTSVLARGMSVDHVEPVFLYVKAGMTVIVTDTEGAWRMADVDTGVINWVNADLVTHICPRV